MQGLSSNCMRAAGPARGVALLSCPCRPAGARHETWIRILELPISNDSVFTFMSLSFADFISLHQRTGHSCFCWGRVVLFRRCFVAARDGGTDKPGRAGRRSKFGAVNRRPAPNKKDFFHHEEKQKRQKFAKGISHGCRNGTDLD
jgi:hypothetical protein